MNDTPAFPTGIITDGKGKIIGGSNGMTLRDYFAAKAMQGWLVETSEGVSVTAVARFAYEVADAMMKEREA